MSVRLSSAIAASLLVIVPVLASAQSLNFEKTLTVGASPSLDVSTGSGEVVVQAGSGNAMVIRGTVKVRTGSNVPSNAADLAQRLVANPPITQTGDAVTVGKITDEDTRRAVSVSYNITVPGPTAVQANSGSGPVSVTGVGGAVKANSGSGSVMAAAIGGDVDLRTGSGDITLKDGKKGAALSTGSGSIGVSGKPTGDWKVSAASGNVTVDVPEGQGFSLDASTSSGSLDITPPLTVQGRVDRRRVQGTVHGGGPMLRLSTASGNIAVK